MKYLSVRLPGLPFESQEEERLFAEMAYPQWLRYSTVGGLLALLFNNAFLLLDYMIGPQVFEVGLRIRFYLCTSFGLFVVAFGVFGMIRPVRVPRLLQEGLVVAASILAGLSILLVATLSPIHGTMWGLLYHAGLVPIMVFASVMTRLRFRAVILLVTVLLIMHWVALALSPSIPGAPVGSIMLTVAAPGLFVLGFSYMFEKATRHRFLQKRRAGALRERLQEKRVALEQASQRDPLTGAFNRRGLDVFMEGMLSQQHDGGQAYAMALIDVDHFKLYNDGYGHPAGDECLCAVSQVLTREAKDLSGILARWGGEEFVVAWPRQREGEDALAIGRRLCDAVAGISRPHGHSLTASVVTVSVGLACSGAASAEEPWSAVLARADAALYAAKRQGRHRACLDGSPS